MVIPALNWNVACLADAMLAALPRLEDAPLPELPRFAPADAAELKPLRRLKGHSGADIMLCLRGARSVVHKTAGSVAQNARLSRQAEISISSTLVRVETGAGCI